MDVRQAEAADLAACAALVDSVQSTHVWQLRLAHDPLATQPLEELGGTLHRTRLPRPVVVRPASAEPLDALWLRAADVLVLDADDQSLAGYIVLTLEPRAPIVTVERLAVVPQLRQMGLAGRLLRAAAQWGRAQGLEALSTHCAARNDPAVRCFMRWGLRFAGYSEAVYPYGEAALFWQRPV